VNEEAARGWIAGRHGTDAAERIAAFLDLVIAENTRQNLVSPASVNAIWSRHAADSAQLLGLVHAGWQSWIDIGTGGGFPGMVIALLAPERTVVMVEPRRKRAAFLDACVDALDLPKASVVQARIEMVDQTADVISARAVASVENLLQAAGHCAKADTTWLLPRGSAAERDQASLAKLNPSMFHVEHSITDPQSTILVMKGRVR
jgi:16S rRNA (guanine527-N7)-methyltransferase